MPMDDEIVIKFWDDDDDDNSDFYGKITEKKIEGSRKMVMHLAGTGCTNDEIANLIEVGKTSLKRLFQKELSIGRSTLKSSLRRAQCQSAIQERVPQMMIWLGKQYLDQKDSKQQLEHTAGITVEKVEYKE